MINLLPPAEKIRILMEEKRKMMIIIWFLVLFFFLNFSLILLAIKFHINGEIKVQNVLLDSLKGEIKQNEARGFHKEINLAESVLGDLSSFYKDKIYFEEILERVSNSIPQEAYLNNLSVVFYSDKEGEVGFIISLAGFSPDRKSLFDFKNNLEKETDFKEVYFPPINWVKPSDIDFSVSFKIIKNKTAPLKESEI